MTLWNCLEFPGKTDESEANLFLNKGAMRSVSKKGVGPTFIGRKERNNMEERSRQKEKKISY